MIMIPVRYDINKGYWIVIKEDQKGYKYADN